MNTNSNPNRTFVQNILAAQVTIPKNAQFVPKDSPEGTEITVRAHLHAAARAHGEFIVKANGDEGPRLVNCHYYGNLKPGKKLAVCDVTIYEKDTDFHGKVRYIDFEATTDAPTCRLGFVPADELSSGSHIKVEPGCQLSVSLPKIKITNTYTCTCGTTATVNYAHDEEKNGAWKCEECRPDAEELKTTRRLEAFAKKPKRDAFVIRTPRAESPFARKLSNASR